MQLMMALIMSFYAAQDPGLSADPNSAFWKGIPGIAIERSIMGDVTLPNLKAEVRSRWTDKNLYLLYVAHYEALHTKPDTVTTTETYAMWNYDVFEAYVGSDFEHTNKYWELMISPNGEYLDQGIDSTVARPGLSRERDANTGMKVKSSIDAEHKIWVGELQIPWPALDKRTPKVGNELRVNFFRQDGAGGGRGRRGGRRGAGATTGTLVTATTPAATPVASPGQAAAPGAASTRGGRTFQAWQPTGVWAPHHPENFGTLRLVAPPQFP